MQYSHDVGSNRTRPEEIPLYPRVASSNFPDGMGAIKKLVFRWLVATEDGYVIRPPESRWDSDYKTFRILTHVTIGDEFGRSVEPLVLESPVGSNNKPTDNHIGDGQGDENKEDENNIGEGENDWKANKIPGEETNNEPQQNNTFEPTPDNEEENMETKPSNEKAKDKLSIFDRLGPHVELPVKESTPVNAVAGSSTNDGKGASASRILSKGKPQAGRKGHMCFPHDSGALSDQGIMEWYAMVVDDDCPIDDEAICSLFKADKIKQKFLEACNDHLATAQSQESETASMLQLSLAELMSKQSEGQAKAEAEANTYCHIARNLKVEEISEACMDYDYAVSNIEFGYEQTILVTTTHFSRKRAKVVADTKAALKVLFEQKINSMMQSRAELVAVLKREESAVNMMIQELRDDAISDRSCSAGWVADTFEAIEALRGLYFPAKSWDSLDALLNSKPSLLDSLYSALGGKYRLNRPGSNLDLSIEDDDSATAKKLQALITVFHTCECVEPAPVPKKKQVAPTKTTPSKITRSKQQQQQKDKPQVAQTTENARKVLKMTLKSKRMAFNADDKVLQLVRSSAYPDYTFADITRYYSDETKLVSQMLVGINKKDRTLLSQEEFMTRSGLSLEEMKALIKTAVK